MEILPTQPTKDDFEIEVRNCFRKVEPTQSDEDYSDVEVLKCFKKVRYDDTYHHRYLPLYPIIIQAASPLEVPLEVGCSACGIKIIRLEDSGMCRVCDFVSSWGWSTKRVFHSRVEILGRP